VHELILLRLRLRLQHIAQKRISEVYVRLKHQQKSG